MQFSMFKSYFTLSVCVIDLPRNNFSDAFQFLPQWSSRSTDFVFMYFCIFVFLYFCIFVFLYFCFLYLCIFVLVYFCIHFLEELSRRNVPLSMEQPRKPNFLVLLMWSHLSCQHYSNFSAENKLATQRKEFCWTRGFGRHESLEVIHKQAHNALQLDFKFHHFPNRNWNVSVRTEKKSNRFGSEYITKKVGPTLQIPKTIFSSS